MDKNGAIIQLRSASETKAQSKNANGQHLKKRGQSIGNHNHPPQEGLTDEAGNALEFDARNESPTKLDGPEPQF